MRKLNTIQLEKINGGVCTTTPNDNFPFPCFDSCQIAHIASGGNFPLVCIL